MTLQCELLNDVLAEVLIRSPRDLSQNYELALIRACIKEKLQVRDTSLLSPRCQQFFHRDQNFVNSG